ISSSGHESPSNGYTECQRKQWCCFQRQPRSGVSLLASRAGKPNSASNTRSSSNSDQRSKSAPEAWATTCPRSTNPFTNTDAQSDVELPARQQPGGCASVKFTNLAETANPDGFPGGASPGVSAFSSADRPERKSNDCQILPPSSTAGPVGQLAQAGQL